MSEIRSVPALTSSGIRFVDAFDAQVAKSPIATALICGEQKLTYQQLDERANQLAGYLISLGVQPDVPVGVCVTRSLDMVVAILGVIKAGGAYLPLDPAYPVDRLSFILEDAHARIVVTQNALSGLFQDPGIKLVSLDVCEQEINQFRADKPETLVTAENLVYVIYTSGSTGKPKGVMITHASLVNFVEVSLSVLDVRPEDVYLQSATIAYALSVRQLMVPLLVGATVVIASSDEIGDPLELFKLIKRRHITLMDMVPSVWRSCIQRLSELPKEEQASLMDNSLRRIVSIGEALMFDLPRDWMDRFGHQVKLVNIFGQTETTGVVATYPIPDDVRAGFGIVPIGCSAARTRLYILDSNMQPVPDGEVGELCVSNPCLAKGYLNRPELTAEKFITNPFTDGFSERMYRTGDMARRGSDGNIEYLGRGDQQVKIRGQRLELGEVEAALREYPSVRDCVVMARGDNPDEKYLAAYVVIPPGTQRTQVDLKEFMRKRLPEYMVPAVIMFLDALPLHPNGKVNRLALPDPRDLRIEGEAPSGDVVLPRNRVEESIARIWQDAIKLERIGIHDNFFDLGGHSLMAVRILTRIEQDLGVRLPLTSFFHSATIAQLAELVDRREDEARSWSPIVAIQPNGDKPPFFGIHAVGGGVLFWRNIVVYMPMDQPFYAIQSQGVDGVRPALNRIEDMAALYIQEIRKIQPHGPYFLGGFSLGGEIVFEMAQQLVGQGENVDLLVLLDTRNPKRVVRPVRIEGNMILPVVETQPSSSTYETWKRKIKGHFRKIKRLNLSGSVIYIGKQIWFYVRYVSISFFAKLFRLAHKRLPDNLLLRYLRLNHRVALRNYVPIRYPGRVTLFRATESLETDPIEDPMGWGPLAGGGLEVYYFDSSHEMIKPEYAKPIAQKLNECLISVRNHLHPEYKIDRLALPNPQTQRAIEQPSAGDVVLPHTRLEKAMANIWQEALKLERIGIHDNFFNLGGHSLMAVRILTRIERDLGVRLPLTSFFHSATIAQLAELVNTEVDEVRNWSPVVPIQTMGNRAPLFGIHAYEGGSLFWRDIITYMPKDQPFYAIQAQGVDGVRPALNRIEDMASLYIREIRKIQPKGPYNLCGFSLGGEIAFEMGQQLHRLGEKVDLLVMLDTRNPARAIRMTQTEDGGTAPAANEAQIRVSRYEILMRKIQGHFRKLSQLNLSAKLSYIWHQISIRMERVQVTLFVKIYRLAGKRLPDQLLFRYIRKSHSEALTNYAPTFYPGKITLFRATESLKENPVDSPLGWGPLAGGGLEVHYFDATHNLVDTEYAELVARKLIECMLAEQARSNPLQLS